MAVERIVVVAAAVVATGSFHHLCVDCLSIDGLCLFTVATVSGGVRAGRGAGAGPSV